MAKERDFGLTPLDKLFETDESLEDKQREKIQKLDIEEIDPFCNHPFKVRDDEEMQKMAESVKEFGVLNPAIVRPKLNGRYELISGHRRKRACELAGIKEMPVIVRDMSDDEAIICMVDSNMQRETLLPSEKAWAYKMKMDAMNRQGKRTDLTSGQFVPKSEVNRSTAEIGAPAGESYKTVQRYIRLTQLTPELMQLVDEKKIGLNPAYELSFLPDEEQDYVFETIESEEATPTLAQAQKLKKFSQDGRLDEDVALSVMLEEKGNQHEKIKIPREKIEKYFSPGTTPKKMEETIIKALELYRKRQRDMER